MKARRRVARAIRVALVAAVVLCASPALAAAAPSIAITSPLQGSYSKEPTPTFAGTTNEILTTLTVEIYEGASTTGLAVQILTAMPLAETWEATAQSSLPSGEYTALVTQSNGVPEQGSASVTFNIDTTPPAVSLDPVSSPSNDSTPTLTGEGGVAPGDDSTVAVTIYSGDSVGGSVVAAAGVPIVGSSWSYTPSQLPDGTYTAQAVQEDAAGNVGKSAAVTFTIDTTAPVVTIVAPNLHSNDSTPTLSGDAGVLPGDDGTVKVWIYSGTEPTGIPVEAESVSVSGGGWTYTSPHLADGTYTAQAVQEDAAGNVGKSAAVTFTIDTTKPVVTIVAPEPYSSDSTPILRGDAGVLPGDDGTVKATIYRGTVPSGIPVEAESVSVSSGEWSYTSPHLADGTYTAQAVQEDDAGNVGKSAAVTFTVDTTKPVVTIVAPKLHSSDSTPILSGDAGVLSGDDGTVKVSIYSGRIEQEGETVSVRGGEWSFTSARLPDGTYTAQAVQEDEAGNVGKSAAVTFTIETHAPIVSIDPVTSPTDDATPRLIGGAELPPKALPDVKLAIYRGTVIADAVEEVPIIVSEGHWSHTAGHLPDGTYTAQVTQEDYAENVGAKEVTFVVDTKPPELTLTAPANDAVLEGAQPTFSGAAGTAEGDSALVTLRIYAGATASGSPIQSLQVTPIGSTWTSGSAGPALANGIYTVVAEQSDDAGNTAKRTATFAIAVPVGAPVMAPPPLPPTASFQWFPSTPHVGEPVSLVSTSTDAASITSFAWGLSGSGALVPGEHLLTTSFSTPGAHPVRLHVTDANGLSSETAETITVTPVLLALMQPFPVVRIAGSARSSTIKISLFTVQAPVGATVSVTCHGHGCPTKTQRFVVASKARTSGTMLVSFGRFERSLKAGAVLEIRIFMRGEIGKFTRFTVRRGKLPARIDTCLNPTGTQPMSCPSS